MHAYRLYERQTSKGKPRHLINKQYNILVSIHSKNIYSFFLFFSSLSMIIDYGTFDYGLEMRINSIALFYYYSHLNWIVLFLIFVLANIFAPYWLVLNGIWIVQIFRNELDLQSVIRSEKNVRFHRNWFVTNW